jgi:DNA-binding NarL/FixJ family response regulator
MHDDEAHIRQAVRLGADGYVPKAASMEELLQALRTVAAGGCYLSPDVARKVIDLAGRRGPGPVGTLTEREQEILELIASGGRTQEVADQIFLSVKTVKNHLTNIYAKLGVQTAAQAVAEAYRLGVVTGRRAS